MQSKAMAGSRLTDRHAIGILAGLIEGDPWRMRILSQVHNLGLPDCWVAAGFVRNLVWDALHGLHRTRLNDVDVIYFDPEEDGEGIDRVSAALNVMNPSVKWEVKNQARMHLRNGDAPYTSSHDAMSYWPEFETAVGARLGADGQIELCAPFGVDGLMAGRLTPNPRSGRQVFDKRVQTKRWLQMWPRLRIAALPIWKGSLPT